MLTIRNLNIKYDQNLILQDVEIDIYRSSITLISGESGSGKTSLLNYLSLNLIDSSSIYSIDGNEVDLSNFEEIQLIQNNKFSYVFQDFTLFPSMTIKESVSLGYKLSNKKVNYKEIKEVLEYVHLSHLNVNSKVKTLSGGERQRLSIAMAIVRDTPYIFMDEPLSSLDFQNKEIIVEIINKLKSEGKGIIIISHDLESLEYDCLYKIDNKHLYKVDDYMHENEQIEPLSKTGYNRNDFFFDIRKTMNTLITLVLTFCIIVSSFVYLYGNGFVSFYKRQANKMNPNELIVYKKLGNYDIAHNSFYPTYIDDLKTINHIKNIYPFYVFSGFITDYEYDDTNKLYKRQKNVTTYEIYQNDQLYMETDIGMCYWSGMTVCAFDSSKDESIENFNQNQEFGVYISKTLYEELNLNTTDNLTFRCPVCIPMVIGYDYVEISGERIPSRVNAGIMKQVELPILGVKTADSPGANNQQVYLDCLYMDYHLMEDILKEEQKLYKSRNVELQNEESLYDYDEQGYYSVIIEADDVKNIPEITDELKQLSSTYITYGNRTWYSNYVDFQNQLNSLHFKIMFVLGFVIIILSYIVMKLIIDRSSKEFAFFKVNGLNLKTTLRNYLFKLITNSFIITVIFILIAKICLDSIAANEFVSIDFKYCIYLLMLTISMFMSWYFGNIKKLNELNVSILSAHE